MALGPCPCRLRLFIRTASTRREMQTTRTPVATIDPDRNEALTVERAKASGQRGRVHDELLRVPIVIPSNVAT